VFASLSPRAPSVALAPLTHPSHPSYTDAEDAVLDRVGNELRGYGKSSSLFEPLSSNDHLVTTTLLRPSSNTSDLATVHSTATVDAKASACLYVEP
jgi:hypothetical protein